MLTGLATSFRRHGSFGSDRARTFWAAAVFTSSIIFWLSAVDSYRGAELTAPDFLLLLAQATALYFAADLVSLARESGKEADREFILVRRPFFVALGVVDVIDLLDTARNGGMELILALGPSYYVAVLLQLTIYGIGYFVARERILVLLAATLVVGHVAWLFTVPRVL